MLGGGAVDRFEDVKRLKAEGKTNEEIGEIYGVSEASIRRWLKKGRAPAQRVPEIEEELREAGYDPADFEPSSVRRTARGELAVSYRRSRDASLRIIWELAQEPVVYKPRPPKRRRPAVQGDSRFAVVVTDRHLGSGFDPVLHELSLQLLAWLKPDFFADLGDTIDVDQFGRFAPSDPKWVAQLRDEVRAARQAAFADVAGVLPEDTEKVWVPGNHEWRLVKWLLSTPQGMALYELLVEEEGAPLWAQLLKLADFGFEYVGSDEGPDYPYAERELFDTGLYLIHGETSRAGSGNSVRAAITKHHRSYAMGHVHDRAYIEETVGRDVLTGIEIPAMAKPNLGYRKLPNHQQGFAVFEVWPGGDFTVEFPRYSPGERTLRWRGKTFKA